MKFLVILSILALAAGAALLIVMAGVGLWFPDLREGLAAVEANRKEYRLWQASEVEILRVPIYRDTHDDKFRGEAGGRTSLARQYS